MLLAVVAALPYLQTLNHDFIDYDDNQYITQNEIVRRGLTWEGVEWAFTTTAASNWHPLTWISHMIDAQAWGDWAGGHHLTNVLLHAINCALVCIALAWMTGSLWRSAAVGLIFAVHPLHVESVAWVAERKDVLSTFFGLLALIAYVRYVKRPDFWRYAVVACAFACSLMSKPMLVTLPFVLLLLDWWPLERLALKDGARVGRVLIEKVPLLALSIASSVITIIAQKSGGAMYALEWLPLHDRIANAITGYGLYLIKSVWPVNLAVIYPLRPPHALAAVGSSIALLAISAVVVALSRRRPALLVGWLWFLGTLVPVIGLVQVGSQAIADRYMYVPMIGLLVMLAWAAPESWMSRPRARALVNLIVGVIAATLLVATWVQVSRWKNTITLFSHAIASTDRNVFAHNVLGHALSRLGRLDQAQQHLTLAARLNPDYPPIHNNLGSLMMQRRSFAEAQAHFEKSLRLNDREPAVWNNLGNAVLEQGRLGEAEAHYRRALELKPNFAEALVNLGRALAAQGRIQQAIDAYREAIQIRADLPEAHANLGAALWNQGRAEEAIAAYQTALQHQPDLVDTRIHLGVALAAQERFDRAIAEFEHALRLDPRRDDARQFLELARQQMRGHANQ